MNLVLMDNRVRISRELDQKIMEQLQPWGLVSAAFINGERKGWCVETDPGGPMDRYIILGHKGGFRWIEFDRVDGRRIVDPRMICYVVESSLEEIISGWK